MNDILYPASPVWKRIEKQEDNAITEIVVLHAYKVRKLSRLNDYNSILTVGNWGKLSELGELVENAIKEAKFENCKIDLYSINDYKVGLEKSCNRLSLVVYGHWNEPCSIEEAKMRIRTEMINKIEKPINKILEGKEVLISSSSYNDGDCITNWESLEQLQCGGYGHFMEGHFCRPQVNRQ